MKWCDCKQWGLFLVLLMISVSSSAKGIVPAKDSIKSKPLKGTPEYYESRVKAYRHFWESLIPNQGRIQYAGSVGLFNWGIGWHYGGKQKRLWETDIMYGFIPKHHDEGWHSTFTLRQTYIPFRFSMPLLKNVKYEPLATGLIANTISGADFWTEEPDKYPKKYYGFSTAIRFHAFVGQRIRFEIPQNKRKYVQAISFCYEFSASDLYAVSYATNKYLTLRDILSLSVGIKVDAF